MADEIAVAQARKLLAELHEKVEDISRKLEAIEERRLRNSARGGSHDQRHRNLRRDLLKPIATSTEFIADFHRLVPKGRAYQSRHLAAEDCPEIW